MSADEFDASEYEFELSPSPHLDIDYKLPVPVEIEVPPDTVAACRRGYENRKAAGADPDFADFLWDVITIDATFTVNGQEIDPETGHAEQEGEQ